MVRIERRRALREAIEDLRRYSEAYDLASLTGSRDAQRLVLHALYVAVQACLDEALEQCKLRGLGPPASYRDGFVLLAQAGLLDAQLAARLADWASFRNVLAHFYPVISMERVYDALGDVGDLEAFETWASTRP